MRFMMLEIDGKDAIYFAFSKNPSTRHLANNGLEMKENEISK